MTTLQQKIDQVKISLSSTVIQALKKMDEEQLKLLLIEENYRFMALLSIGDIQRAIINNIPLDERIDKIIRKENTVCSDQQSIQEVKEVMVAFRTEFMPILNNQQEIVDLIFWKDVFDHAQQHNMFPQQVPVVIMAGGFGSRLKPLTNVIPKPLIPIGERTILEEIVLKFKNYGSSQFFITVNYKKEFIKYYFEHEVQELYDITYLDELTPLGTAGSLYLAKPFIQETFFVSNCDIVIDTDYTEIYKYHKQTKNDITLVASMKQYKIPYGTVESTTNGELVSLKEKPELIFKVNTGMYVLEPHVLGNIEDGEFLHITDLMERVKAKGGRVGVFPISEHSWYDIGEWSEYNKIIAKQI